MLLKKVYLDYIYLDSLEQILIKNHWSKQSYDGSPLERFPRHDKRNWLRKKTLRLITLFENIDSDFSIVDMSRLIREGVVSKDAHMIDDSPRPIFSNSPQYKGTLHYEQERLLNYSEEVSYDIVKAFHEKVIRFHYQTSPPGFYNRSSRTAVKVDDLFSEFEWVFEQLLDDETTIINKKPHLTRFADSIGRILLSLQEGVYYSCYEGGVFVTALNDIIGPEPAPINKMIDDLYYLVKTRLTDEILILPEPRSLSEAIDMREKKEMVRFRNVLSNWLITLQEGNESAEKKIRKDINKANRELKKLKRWKEYENSPLNFWLNSIGGHIPILSNILTAVTTLGRVYSKWTTKSNSWLMLSQKKL